MTDQDNIRVLLVDDSDTDRESVFREIYNVFCVLEAKTGREAVNIVKHSKPACVLLDYRLPDFDGLDLLEQFVEQQIPVVMLTGQGNEELAARAIKMGAEDYLSKSMLTKETLIRAVANAIEKFNLRKKLDEREQDVADFVAFTSDEMRLPLQDISAAAGTLGNASPAHQGEADTIFKRIDRLNSIIDAMVEYTRVDRLSGDFDPIDLERCIAEAQATLQSVIAAARAIITAGRMPIVRGSSSALTEVFRQLITYAISSAKEVSPQIRIYSTLDKEMWTISVVHNGNDDEKEEETDNFERRSGENEIPRGVGGLGLVTCAKIIKEHGGRIWTKSELAGTTFHFTLPKSQI